MSAKKEPTKDEKRQISPLLIKVLALDVELTKKFVSFSLNFVPIRSLKVHCKLLEVSMKDVGKENKIIFIILM